MCFALVHITIEKNVLVTIQLETFFGKLECRPIFLAISPQFFFYLGDGKFAAGASDCYVFSSGRVGQPQVFWVYGQQG